MAGITTSRTGTPSVGIKHGKLHRECQLENYEKGARVAIKVLLIMRIIFLILHFVFMVQNQSHRKRPWFICLDFPLHSLLWMLHSQRQFLRFSHKLKFEVWMLVIKETSCTDHDMLVPQSSKLCTCPSYIYKKKERLPTSWWTWSRIHPAHPLSVEMARADSHVRTIWNCQ